MTLEDAGLPRAIGWVLAVAGLGGTAASFIIAVEKFRVLADPSYVPGCTLDARFSCATVMGSWQAELFGFPNPLIGIAGFPVIAFAGLVLALGGWIPMPLWWSLEAGALAGAVFVHWLFLQSVFVIGALCLYCMAVWVCTIFIAYYATLATFRGAAAGAGVEEPARGGLHMGWHAAAAALWASALLAVAVVAV